MQKDLGMGHLGRPFRQLWKVLLEVRAGCLERQALRKKPQVIPQLVGIRLEAQRRNKN